MTDVFFVIVHKKESSKMDQDWETVVIRGKGLQGPKARTKEQAASRALQSGGSVTTVRKEGSRPSGRTPAYKLDAIGTDAEPDIVQRL